ncbi:MAG: class I SAM-dependent methyltransferase [Lentisphaeria bacterium]|nr:class I SAM-dependent methyltransferase [Lentisphaeria bacterium]
MPEAKIILKKGREKSLLRRHPWVFSGAVDKITGAPSSGDTVKVVSASNEFLAYAAYSEKSQLTARCWSFDEEEYVNEEFFRSRLLRAKALRDQLQLNDSSSGCRLVYSESDGLPGVIIDRFGKWGVAQFLSAGSEKFRDIIGKLALEIFGLDGIYERSDTSVRSKENLAERKGMLAGSELPEEIEVIENGLRFSVDPRHGQKTGFYFDLRDVRSLVSKYAPGKKMLNAFCFTGGFACAALKAGASSVLNLDSSRPALAQAEKNLRLNGFDSGFENRAVDCFEELKKLVSAGEKFDFIILDPPKLVESRNSLERGCRAYQFLARMGYRLLNPGGVLFNLSCSGLMEMPLFQKITCDAALEAGVDAVIIDTLRQGADHPVMLTVPETAYLKGLVTTVVSAKQGS